MFLFPPFFVMLQKVFMKTFNAFTKPFEEPQRSVTIKIQVNFSPPRSGREGLQKETAYIYFVNIFSEENDCVDMVIIMNSCSWT